MTNKRKFIKAEPEKYCHKCQNLDQDQDDNKGKENEEVVELAKKISDKVKLNNVANIKDLAAIAKAGINFKGAKSENIHKNIGETIEIVKKGVKETDNISTTNNTIDAAVNEGKLEVGLSEELKAMKSIETVDSKGNISIQEASGLRVGEKAKKWWN